MLRSFLLLEPTRRIRRNRRTPAFAALMAPALAWAMIGPVAAADAAGGWHKGLPNATEAAHATGRPVLAVFVAQWSAASTRIADALLADQEAAALVNACFEPVLLDVDEHAELARRLRITHVPTAAVLGKGDEVIAIFECPESSTAFVAAAARAAQQAAVRVSQASAAGVGAIGPSANAFDAALAPGQSGSLDTPASAAIPAGRGSISLVTDKVRKLSDFGNNSPAPTAAPAAVAVGFQQPQQPVQQPAPAADPALPTTPPVWPAEQPAAPLAATLSAPPPRQSIEPAPAAAVASPSPAAAGQPSWLGETEPITQATVDVESTAAVSDLPTASPTAPATKSSVGSDFLAAIQKPWSGFARKPAPAVASPAPADSQPAAPPTMPPARPQSPFALTQPPAQQPAAPVAAAAAAAAPAAASQETMPLGLEGYCPVTLADKSVWTEGRAQYGARHRGRTYLFAGLEAQQAFLADPDRYAPALSGDDPVLAFEQGKSMPGQRRYGVVCQSRMYLFASPETRDAFAAQPDRYTSRIALAEQPAAAADGSRRY